MITIIWKAISNCKVVQYILMMQLLTIRFFTKSAGEVTLVRPLDEISAITHIGDPVLLTVIAEEVKVARDEPAALATTVQIALFLPERSNSPPYFENDQWVWLLISGLPASLIHSYNEIFIYSSYVTRIEENSPTGTTLIFPEPYVTRVSDDDSGKNGVFSLTLLGNNGTFEIFPNVAERKANFIIRVRDNMMLDYEVQTSLTLQVSFCFGFHLSRLKPFKSLKVI